MATTQSENAKKAGQLYVLVGWPGSGKTTYIRERLSSAARVCHDDLYRMISGAYWSDLRLLYHGAENDIIRAALSLGLDVAVDRTCLDLKTRQRFISLAAEAGTQAVAVVMTTGLETAKDWNLDKDRVMAGHYVSMEVYDKLASLAEPVGRSEGFAGVFYFNPLTGITRKVVHSSNIRSVGYDEAARVLEVEFNNRSIYCYYSVPKEVYTEMMSASSHGKYFNGRIKPAGFKYEKMAVLP